MAAVLALATPVLSRQRLHPMTAPQPVTIARPLCGVYLRISDDPGNDELGVARQERWARKFCDDYNFDPVIFADNDRSATNGKTRERYQALLAAVAHGELRAVAAWGQDRLCRQPSEFEQFRDLAKANSVLFGTRTGIKNLARAADTFNARNEVNAASYEVDNMRERMVEKFVELSQAGRAWWPSRPFGYTMPQRGDKRGEWTRPELVKPEAAAIRTAYSAVLAGMSLKAIAREWNTKGIRTPKGNDWDGMKVRQLLLNARNAGLRTYHGEVVGTGNWPAIVTENIWRRVEIKLSNSDRRVNSVAFPARKYLLSGLAKCSECGHGVSGIADTKKTGKPVYVCKQRGCLKVRRRVVDVDAWVTEHVVQHLANSDPADLLGRGATVDVADLLTQSNALRAKQDELAALFASDTINASQLATGTASLTTQIEQLQSEMLHANQSEVLAGLIGVADVRERFDKLPVDRQRAVINRLVTVTIAPGQPTRRPFDGTLVTVAPKS
jgi:DNA invertase Pin-like site-specific DNA recombinase